MVEQLRVSLETKTPGEGNQGDVPEGQWPEPGRTSEKQAAPPQGSGNVTKRGVERM